VGRDRERATAVAAALLASGMRPGTAVGILSASRREWIDVEMGAMLAGGVVVPLHPATTSAAALDIVRRAGIRYAFVEEPLQAEKILAALEPDGPLARIAVFETLSRLPAMMPVADWRSTSPTSRGRGAALAPFAEFLELGRHEIRRGAGSAVERRVAELRPEDPATIVFNWSAAGRPLATVLTHDNIAFTTASVPRELEITAQDRTLLFLPLAPRLSAADRLGRRPGRLRRRLRPGPRRGAARRRRDAARLPDRRAAVSWSGCAGD